MPRSRSETTRQAFRLVVAWLGVVAGSLALAKPAHAGGGPENVLLVVNERSWSSLTIANHYIRLRKIPAQNVVYLKWTEDNERIDAATMRTKLLLPLMAEIDRRRLGDHIDYIVYSADFPWLVDCTADIAPGVALPAPLQPYASLTGVTFLQDKFLAHRPEFLLFDANHYFRPATETTVPTTHAFRSWYGWDAGHRLLEAGGEHYYLSAMLGVTSGRANSTAEVVRMLERSAAADYSRPDGTIYFAANADIRTKPREPLFASAVRELRAAGTKAEVFSGTAPKYKSDVAGAMLGTADFSLKESRTKLLPGAIGEHLTSLSGILYEGVGQTPISEWVRAGSALTSGAVFEPYNVPQKFPSAFMHLHYVRGSSAAEAYYQATSGPYQMLVVGDPLCKPWARRATVELSGLDVSKPASGIARFTPTAKFDDGTDPSAFELYLDGVLIDARPPGEAFAFDSHILADGTHDMRLMAIGPEPIETRSGIVVPLVVANHRGRVTLTRVDRGPVDRLVAEIQIAVSGMDSVSNLILVQGTRVVAQYGKALSVQTPISARNVGFGPVTLQALAISKDGPTASILSAPLELEIEPNEPLPKVPFTGTEKLAAGAALKIGDKPATVLNAVGFEEALRTAGAMPGDTFRIEGFFQVEETGHYQFHLRHGMQLLLKIDDHPVYEADGEQPTLDYVPLALAAGRHKLELTGTTAADPRFDIRFGLRGVQRFKPSDMNHDTSK